MGNGNREVEEYDRKGGEMMREEVRELKKCCRVDGK